MEIFLGAVLLGLIPGFIARHKGRSFWAWWFFGALLWIVAFPVSLFLKRDTEVLRERELQGGHKKRCSECAETVKAEAVVCRYCGFRFAPETSDQVQDRLVGE